QITASRDTFENAGFFVGIYFDPLDTTALSAQFEGLGDAQLITALLANGNHVTSFNLVRRDVHGLTVDGDRLVGNQLTGFRTSGAVAHAIHDVVETAFEQLQQVLAGSALTTSRFLVVTAELTLEHAIDTTYFLLFTQLGAVVGQATATLAMNAWRSFDVALGFERARTTLQ